MMDKAKSVCPRWVANSFFILIFISLTWVNTAKAATTSYSFEENNFAFTINFDKGYSNVNAIKTDSEIVVTFDTTEDVAFERQDFFDSAVNSVKLKTEGTRKTLSFNFENNAIIEPKIQKQAKALLFSFEFPVVTTPPPPSAVPNAQAYLRMFFGLGIVLVIILLAYGVMKMMFKNNIITDIPGVGRLLGRASLDMKKQLMFYELGDIIYILGVTDGAISLVDKIVDPAQITVIKSGFARRKDFSSYLKFFQKKHDVGRDIKATTEIIEEKTSSLRKR